MLRKQLYISSATLADKYLWLELGQKSKAHEILCISNMDKSVLLKLLLLTLSKVIVVDSNVDTAED